MMDGIKNALERFILDPSNHDFLAMIKAARNGAVYGAKVRFPHALVMVFLFKSGTFRQKVGAIWKATRTHGTNLAVFALIYKTCMKVLSRLPHNEIGAKHQPYDPFLAGLVGGYFVFGRGVPSSVNQQIVTYVFARVVLAFAKLSVQEGGILPVQYRDGVANNAWPVFAAVSWASVMFLHTYHEDALQASLKSSMRYIYTNAENWSNLKNFIWHNT